MHIHSHTYIHTHLRMLTLMLMLTRSPTPIQSSAEDKDTGQNVSAVDCYFMCQVGFCFCEKKRMNGEKEEYAGNGIPFSND